MPHTERKNLIESKKSRPMRYLFAANEKSICLNDIFYLNDHEVYEI